MIKDARNTEYTFFCGFGKCEIQKYEKTQKLHNNRAEKSKKKQWKIYTGFIRKRSGKLIKKICTSIVSISWKTFLTYFILYGLNLIKNCNIRKSKCIDLYRFLGNK